MVALRDGAENQRAVRGISTAPRVIVRNFQPHKSAITGELIRNERQYRDHLKKHDAIPAGGCDAESKPQQQAHFRPGLVKSAMHALGQHDDAHPGRSVAEAADLLRERGLME